MRNVFILFVFLGFSCCEKKVQTQTVSTFTPTVLYLKYSCKLNNDWSFHRVFVKVENNKEEHELRDAYSFDFKNKYQDLLDNDFYVWNVNEHLYADTTNKFYWKAIAKTQLRDKFFLTRDYIINLYFRSFTHIYIIDLDLPHPKKPNLFKMIEVRPYNYFDHFEIMMCGGMLRELNKEKPEPSEWQKLIRLLYYISER